MATPSNILGRTKLPKISGRRYAGLKGLDGSPRPATGPSDMKPGHSSEINVPMEPRAGESSLAPSLEKRGASLPSEGIEIDFAELKDGTPVELLEDPANPNRTLLGIWQGREVHLVDRLEQDSQLFIPPARNSEILRHIRLPKDAKPYDSVQELLRRLETFISQCVAVDEQHVAILADFVLSTWFIDRFSVAPYLSVIGLPQSGKTTLLRVLSLVCRRSLLIADITSAGFYQACARFMPTMLIDEAGSIRNGRTLRHMLRSGTTQDVLAVRKNRIFHCYGAKVISWLEPPDDAALNSRCVLIPMFESKSTALCRTDEPKMQQLTAELQAQLLTFRLENYKTVKPAAVAGDEVLRPRTRDLLRALSACHAQDTQRCQGLLKFFESGEAVPLEPLSPEHNAVLRALFAMIHIGDFSFIFISDLADKVNRFLEQSGDRLRLLPRKVGAVLTSFGFTNRTRTNSGWVLYLSQQDAEKLHQLAACYGIDGFKDRFLSMSPEDCTLCRAAGLHKKGPDLPPAPPGYQVTTKELDLRRS